jgi:hypothetical protein
MPGSKTRTIRINFRLPVRLRAPRIDRDIRSLANDLSLLLADELPKNAAKP